jgi:hypothetical protein
MLIASGISRAQSSIKSQIFYASITQLSVIRVNVRIFLGVHVKTFHEVAYRSS